MKSSSQTTVEMTTLSSNHIATGDQNHVKSCDDNMAQLTSSMSSVKVSKTANNNATQILELKQGMYVCICIYMDVVI